MWAGEMAHQAHCSRGSGFGSQHSEGSSQSSVTPVPGAMIPYLTFTGSCTHVHTYIHSGTHVYIKSTKFLKAYKVLITSLKGRLVFENFLKNTH